jgi:hypothetical protein
MSKIPMLIATILFAVCVSFPQQPATGDANTPDPTKAAEQEQAKKDFRKNRTAFLNDTLVDLQNLRTRENRIFFSSEIASIMWKENETRARSLFANAAGELIEVIRQTDQALTTAKTNDGPRSSFGLFSDPPDSMVLRRKMSAAMGVRRGLTSAILELDPDLAFSFFLDSRDVISDPELKKSIQNQDGYYEGQLLAELARTNAKKAVELGKRSLKDGVTYSHIQLLQTIYAKDADRGVEFGSAILSSLKSSDGPPFPLFELLDFAGETAKDAGKTGKPPVYTDGEIREIAEILAHDALDTEVDENLASRIASNIEKYLPSRAIQIRAKYKLSSPEGSGRGEAYTIKAPPPVMNTGIGSGADNQQVSAQASTQEEQAKAMRDVMTLGTKKLSDEERQKIVSDARRIISGSNDRSQKIIGLGMLATQVAKFGDKDLAAQIMRDAEAFVNPQPRNARDFLCSWMLVSGYAETDPDKAFRLLDDLIYRGNDVINAAIRVAEFIDVNEGIFVDDEIQLGDFGSSMIRGMTGTLNMGIGPLRSLAKADFKRAAGLTDRLQRPEARILAKMLFLRAVYQDEVAPENDGAVEEALK